MNTDKRPGRNKFVRWFVPGVWIDQDGNHHVDIVGLCKMFDLEPTPENVARAMQIVRSELLQAGVDPAQIRERLSPQD